MKVKEMIGRAGCAVGVHRVVNWMYAAVSIEAWGYCERCGAVCHRPVTPKEREESWAACVYHLTVTMPEMRERMQRTLDRIRQRIAELDEGA
jgi:hypothetical protein